LDVNEAKYRFNYLDIGAYGQPGPKQKNLDNHRVFCVFT